MGEGVRSNWPETGDHARYFRVIPIVFLLAFATHLWMLFVARVIGGFLSAANMPTVMAYVADVTSEEDRGKGMGIIGAATGLGFIFGPAVGGVFSKISLEAPFT